jgi:hypothetical protein
MTAISKPSTSTVIASGGRLVEVTIWSMVGDRDLVVADVAVRHRRAFVGFDVADRAEWPRRGGGGGS